MSDKPRRKLTVVGMDHEFTGLGKESGNEFTIYNVDALDEAGLPVQERLRTFDKDLPRNELVEYEVEPRDDRHGKTYTISIPGKRTGGGGSSGGGLKGSVDTLRNRVEALERRLDALERGDKPELQSLATPPGAGAPAGGATF